MTERISIAIADDSAVIRDLVEEVLRFETAYSLVASFESGFDTVDWVNGGGTAEVIIVDMRLPGGGPQTIEGIRAKLPDIRIVAFSASAQQSSIDAAIEAGADAYLLKESPLSDLLDALSGANLVASGDARSASGVSESKAALDGIKGIHVLVIDDHDLIRSATRSLLELEGCLVSECESGAEVIELLESGHESDVALVDMRLGDIGGEELIKKMREVRPQMALIVHSGAADVEGDGIVSRSGADGFLAKGSYSLDELVAALRKAVDGHQGG